MNADLIEVITAYATSTHDKLNALLLRKSKQNLMAVLVDLLTTYYNDKNSSKLREFVVVSLSGFKANPDKIGYNGYKHDGVGVPVQYCEAKPKNINTNNNAGRKLNGDGNFTDYTWARLKRDKKANPMMLVAGFLDGRLIYIFKFPFKSKAFVTRLEEQLRRRLPDGDKKGHFLRSASFSFKHYKTMRSLQLNIFVDQKQLAKCRDHISAELYQHLCQSL